MEDLAGTSGLPLWLDTQRSDLYLAQPGEGLRPEPQPLRLMRQVLLDRDATGPEVLYWRFPDVALPTDEGVFSERGVRHDLLMLRPGRVGAEFIKTWGHALTCGAGLWCPEVYGVLRGRALFLLQEQAEEPAEPVGRVALSDVRQIDALAGQKVIVPARYGVVVINPGSEPLVLSSLLAAQSSRIHQVYHRMRGAAYYVTERDDEIAVEPNRRYAEPLPPLREDAPLRAPDLGVVEEKPLYSAFVHQPESFRWLQEGAPVAAGAA
jgi:glucose-6-phosphate isomerase